MIFLVGYTRLYDELCVQVVKSQFPHSSTNELMSPIELFGLVLTCIKESLVCQTESDSPTHVRGIESTGKSGLGEHIGLSE
jgi:hypothetical protein